MDLSKDYLTESQARSLSYPVIIQGYLRKHCDVVIENAPQVIVDLCVQFAAPPVFDQEAEDPINFISDLDIKVAEKLKVKGNMYFTEQEFHLAITKYTAGLQHNPNNHLLWSNRAYCNYLTKNYDDALEDIQHCVRLEPAFSKGWFRYGLILGKLKRFGKAGIAFRTALRLSNLDEAEERLHELYKKQHTNFMKFLKNKNKIDALRYISNFGRTHNASKSREDMLNRMLESIAFKTAKNWDEMHAALMEHPEMTKFTENQNFAAIVERSRYKEYMVTDGFRFSSFCTEWKVGWSSTPVITNNKREFAVSVGSGDRILDMPIVTGIPTAKQMINVLFQTMAYSEVQGVGTVFRTIKPVKIVFIWRMKDTFAEIAAALEPFGIICELERETISLMNCYQNGTRLDGMNHL